MHPSTIERVELFPW